MTKGIEGGVWVVPVEALRDAEAREAKLREVLEMLLLTDSQGGPTKYELAIAHEALADTEPKNGGDLKSTTDVEHPSPS